MNSDKKHKKEPLISIGLPVFNGERFIVRALNSLLNQEYLNLEIIVSDNDSTDRTREILQRYAERDSRLKLHFQQKNIGILSNFHFVLDHSQGEFFFWAACDDWWDPQFISRLKKGLDFHPASDVAMCSFSMVDEKGESRGQVLLSGENDLSDASYHKVFQKMIGRHPIHVFLYGLFRSEFLKKIMMRQFPKCMMGDRVLMCEITLSTHLLFIGEILHCRTVHDSSLSERYGHEEFGEFWKERARFFKLFWVMLKRLITSPHIPWIRKISSVPIGWIQLVARGTWTIGKKMIRRIS